MNTAEPEATRTKSARATARTMLVLDRNWMPRSMPETAEATKHRPRTMMMPTATAALSAETVPVSARPARICSAPRPREAAVPKTVAKIARMSRTLPCQPSARFGPISGTKALEMRCRPP